jgi:hypothetical protein
MLRNLIYGNFDSSVAGFAITKDRSEFVDYPVLSVKSQPGVFVRRPIQAYLSEFSMTAWFSVGVYFCSFCHYETNTPGYKNICANLGRSIKYNIQVKTTIL